MLNRVRARLRTLASVVAVALLASGAGAPELSAPGAIAPRVGAPSVSLLLTPLGSPAATVTGEYGAHTISAHHDRPSSDLRSGQQVELVSTEQRAIVRIPAHAVGIGDSESEAPCALARGMSRWCDVVQCRRLAGALLLGYATPPPTRSRS